MRGSKLEAASLVQSNITDRQTKTTAGYRLGFVCYPRKVHSQRLQLLLPPLHLALDVGDAVGGLLFLVVRLAGCAQNQAVSLDASLPLAPVQIDGITMGHSLRRAVL